MLPIPVVIGVLGEAHGLEVWQQPHGVQALNNRRVVDACSRLVKDRGVCVNDHYANTSPCELECRDEAYRPGPGNQNPIDTFHR